MRNTWQGFSAAFKDAGKVCWPLVAIYVLINGIVLYNAVFHRPDVQYDALGHQDNIQVISTGQLPTPSTSLEYYSAPLAYFLPALIMRLTGLPIVKVAKLGQLLNVLLSLGLTFTLLKIAARLSPGRISARLVSLGMLGLFPVYYRTFAYPRGEPYVALLTMLAIYQTLRVFSLVLGGWLHSALLGLTLGLVILARQWGFFFLPAFYIFAGMFLWSNRALFKPVLARLVLITLVAALTGGWFYLSLYLRYGTVTAFNRTPGDQFFANQPADFYSGNGNGYLFTKPVRPLLSNQLYPLLYADTWGDYWGYFLIKGTDTRNGSLVLGINFERAITSPSHPWLDTNYDSFGAYLGQVNLVSVLPSFICIVGLLFGIWELFTGRTSPEGNEPLQISRLLTLALVFSLGGYFWFLITYPSGSVGGTTIKASYMLQAFPLFALLAANWFEKVSFLRGQQKWLWALGLVFLFDFPALITHYFALPWN